MPGLERLSSNRWAPYAFTVVFTATVAVLLLRPWSMAATDVFAGGEDIAALQANVLAAGQVGPFGVDPHLAWPEGYPLWGFPQLGVLLLAGSWLLNGVLHIGSGATALWLLVAAVSATSASTLFFIRSILGRLMVWLCAALATTVGLSPFFFMKLGHLNVAVFFAVPLVLGLLIRGADRSRRWWIAAAAFVMIVIAVTPLWWGIVLILMLLVIALGTALQRSWRRLAEVAVIGVGTTVGLGFQYLLFMISAVPGRQNFHGRWNSISFGGQLTDLLLPSPLLNGLYDTTTASRLMRGASAEFKPLGIICALGLVAVLLIVLRGLPRRVAIPQWGPIKTQLLALISIVALLFYLAGGLGNLQAGLAVLLGASSPARTWSRLTIIIAICGITWIAIYFGRWTQRTKRGRGTVQAVSAAVATVALVVAVVELKVVPTPPQSQASSIPEYAPVRFLESRTDPCPVAQLPQDASPIPRLLPSDIPRETANDLFYYRGYYPYLLAPDYFWSFSSWAPKRSTTLNSIGSQLDPAGVERLRATGFCAIFYDKLLAQASQKTDEPLEGTTINGLPAPDFVSNRYDVYLLAGD